VAVLSLMFPKSTAILCAAETCGINEVSYLKQLLLPNRHLYNGGSEWQDRLGVGWPSLFQLKGYG
jgi:hypothetical protein